MKHMPKVKTRQHALTVILEDYCHVGPIRRVVPPGYWHRFESRVERNTRLTLDLLDEMGAKATFFALGWIADHQPEVIAEVVARGHEIASKGYYHRAIKEMSPQEFRDDALRSKEALERAGGVAVRGYRMARDWFAPEDLWALDTLADCGYAFDSSIRPLGLQYHDEPYRRFVHPHQRGDKVLWEFPLSTCMIGPLAVPIAGGNYVRQLPDGFVRRAVDRWDRHIAAPFVFYFHIWELDPDQPRITAVSPVQRIRQYRNLDRMGERLRHYLKSYSFNTIGSHLCLEPEPVANVEPVPQRTVAEVVAARGPVVSPLKPSTPVSVVIPCYNEEASLGYLSRTLASFADDVRDDYELSYIFVDDGSKDRTWERLHELFGNRADCDLIKLPENVGVAGATLAGVRAAKSEIACAIDCDSTYDPRQLKDMIPMLKPGVDLVTASPYHELGQVMNLSEWRLFLSRSASRLYGLVLHHKRATYTSCFRVYRRSSVADMILSNQRYAGIIEILCQLDLSGGRIVECPAVMEVRLLGRSKMKIVKTIFGHLKLISHVAGLRIKQVVLPRQSYQRGETP